MGLISRVKAVGSRVRSGMERRVEERKTERERTSLIRQIARTEEADETIRYEEKLKGQRKRRRMKERQAPARRTTRRTARRPSRRPERRREQPDMLSSLFGPPRSPGRSRQSNGRTYNPLTMTWADTRKRRKRR